MNPIVNSLLNDILHFIMNHHPPLAVRCSSVAVPKYRGHPARDTARALLPGQVAFAMAREAYALQDFIGPCPSLAPDRGKHGLV